MICLEKTKIVVVVSMMMLEIGVLMSFEGTCCVCFVKRIDVMVGITSNFTR